MVQGTGSPFFVRYTFDAMSEEYCLVGAASTTYDAEIDA
jgi:hypothetical protein